MTTELEHLYEISKLFASFENVEQTFDPALAIVARTLPLRSAILIETDHARMVVWASDGQSSEQLRAVKEHAQAAYTYLVGAVATGSLELTEQAGVTPLPRQAEAEAKPARRFIVIPLVVANRPPFGALQLEGARPLDKADLMFVNAVTNQLAIALDRDRAWRRDITRRDRAETTSDKFEALAGENARLYEKAQKAVSVREQILAIVSHDLRSPLQTILMTTSSLANTAGTDEDPGRLPQALGRIQRASKRMLRLIEDLLDFASIEAGKLAIKRRPQEPGPLIQETLASFESIAQEKQLRLTANVEPNLPKVYCDRDRILQVLANLVTNATKATAAGGHIFLSVESRGPELLFAVSDDGKGIGEEDVKHLFERYWRGDEAGYEGAGLGLAIVRGIVGAHSGRIWVESELGGGATFLFTIPAADADIA